MMNHAYQTAPIAIAQVVPLMPEDNYGASNTTSNKKMTNSARGAASASTSILHRETVPLNDSQMTRLTEQGFTRGKFLLKARMPVKVCM